MPPIAPPKSLTILYETDETAWLEQMASAAAARNVAQLDLSHLSEYLTDMARRDKREVQRRLTVLMVHLLKWDHQPSLRSRSWELNIEEQREELQDLLQSATLRQHADDVLDQSDRRAVRRAAVETSLPETTFPAQCSWSLEHILGE